MTSYFEVNKIPVGTLLNIQIVQPIDRSIGIFISYGKMENVNHDDQ